MTKNGRHLYKFDTFSLDAIKRQLLRDGHAISLGDKAFQALLVLIEHRDRVVPSEDLIKLVWPDIAVHPNNLAQQIINVRRAIGDDTREPARQYVRTIHGQGYKFMADVEEEWEEETEQSETAKPLQAETPPQPLVEPPSKRRPTWIHSLTGC